MQMTAVRTVSVLVVVLVIASFAALGPAFAASDTAPASESAYVAQQAQDGDRDIVKPVLWTLAGIAAAALIMGMLYLLKRRVGGFPENPTWVAPITIMPASENPTEETFGETPAHDSHGSAH